MRKWNECLKDKGLKRNEDKTKVMCESFGTDTTQVIGNVKHPCSVCLKGVGVNFIRYTQCIQWIHARCSRVKGSLKNVESSFICRRCKGELSETRQVNGLHIDGNEYEIVDKLCYLGDMLSQQQQQQQPFILTRLFFPVYWVNLAYGLPTTFSSTFTCPKHLPYKVPSFSYLLSTLLSISSWACLSLHHLPAVSQFSLSNTTHLFSQHGQTISACFVT